jgi:hypothetical protein
MYNKEIFTKCFNFDAFSQGGGGDKKNFENEATK